MFDAIIQLKIFNYHKTLHGHCKYPRRINVYSQSIIWPATLLVFWKPSSSRDFAGTSRSLSVL